MILVLLLLIVNILISSAEARGWGNGHNNNNGDQSGHQNDRSQRENLRCLVFPDTEEGNRERKKCEISDLCSPNGCDKDLLVEPLYPLTAKIAIIGSGMSGILTARKLAQYGYTDITIFEKENQIGGYTKTVEIDGNFYDFQAHLIATKFFSSFPQHEIIQIINETPQQFREEDILWRNQTDQILPLCLIPYLQQIITPTGLNTTALVQFIQDIVTAHVQYSSLYFGQVGEGGPGSTGGPGLDMTWTQFKSNPALISGVGACLHDTLINSANMRREPQGANWVINLNALLQTVLPGVVGSLLKMFAPLVPTWPQLVASFPTTLRISLDHTRCHATITGWNNWMKAIVHRIKDHLGESFKILKNTTVTSLTGSPNGVTIVDSKNKNYRFDVAIITTRPKDTRQFVTSPALKELFNETYCPTVWTRSVLLESENPVQPPLSGNGLGFWIIEPSATLTSVNPTFSLNQFTACNRQNFANLWMCFANTNPPDLLSSTQAWPVLQNQLSNFGWGNSTFIQEEVSNWPVFPAAGYNWYDKARALQGVNNVFFGGEILSGPTIEPIADYVHKAVPYWFRIVPRPLLQT